MSRERERGRSDSRLSVAACRRLLGSTAEGLSDVALEQVRDQLYQFAGAAVSAYTRAKPCPFEDALKVTRADDRSDAEERAAILVEFDAKMPRGAAERIALAPRARHRRQ